MARRGARSPGYEALIADVYDRAASFCDPETVGLSWSEFWTTPTVVLNHYADALVRKQERREREAERRARRG
jgi:hypothetical protein